MIDITKSKLAFKIFLDNYEEKSDVSFKLKVIHTYHVADNAREIAKKLNLSKEDIELAELIGLLHDIGRFEELCYILEGNGTIYKINSEPIDFKKGDIMFISRN